MPNLHPIVVHFPLALLTVSFLFEIAGSLLHNEEASRVGWWLQLTGTVGLAITVPTGLLAQHSVTIVETARATFDTHEQLAFLASVLFALLLYWRITTRTRLPQRRALFLSLFFAAVCILLIGGWFGGELVFRFGTGTVGGAK